jgi:hypothetical protein
MSAVEADLQAYIKAQAAIDLASCDDRIFPTELPSDTAYPAITYQRTGGEVYHHMTGASSLKHPRIQFDCWGERYADAKDLAEWLRGVLNGVKGTVGSTTVQGIFFRDDRDLPEGPLPGEDESLERVTQEFEVFHT